MKFLSVLLCLSVIFRVGTSKIYPDYLPRPCAKSSADYSECTAQFFKQMRPHFLKGIPEINFPKLSPMLLPYFNANRTVGEFVSVIGDLRDVQTWGFEKTRLKDFKFDTKTMSGKLRIGSASADTFMDYNVTGRLAAIGMHGAGIFSSNMKNAVQTFTFSLKKIDKNGAKRYALGDFRCRTSFETGSINLISKTDNQAVADLISSFFNANAGSVLSLIRPIYEEPIEMVYRGLAEKVLNTVPADELIPE